MKKLFLIMMMFVPMTMMAQKFGHVNPEDVIQSLPEFTKAQQELETLGKQYEKELTDSQAELQRQAEANEKNKSTMNATKQQETETKLQEMYQKISEQAQQNQQAFQKAQNDKMQPIYQKVMQAIEAVGKAGGYVYIMQTGSVPFINTDISKDVTSDVKAQLLKMK